MHGIPKNFNAIPQRFKDIRKDYMVVSQNRWTPMCSLIYPSPYYGESTPNFGKPSYKAEYSLRGV